VIRIGSTACSDRLVSYYIKKNFLTMQPVLEVSIYTLLRMAFIWQLISAAIYLVGLLCIATFLYDNLKSLISIIKALLEPYFQPQLPKTLVEKYGQWAGECFGRQIQPILPLDFALCTVYVFLVIQSDICIL